jgi:hypothetical protein
MQPIPIITFVSIDDEPSSPISEEPTTGLGTGPDPFPGVKRSSSHSSKQAPTASNTIDVAPWFKAENVREIRRSLGNVYAQDHRKKKARYLHQNVVVMEMLKQRHSHRINYANNLHEAVGNLRGSSHTTTHQAGRDSSRVSKRADPRKGMVFLQYGTSLHPKTYMKVYDRLTHECRSIYPPREECIWDEAKIYDLQVLEDIARDARTWRPKSHIISSAASSKSSMPPCPLPHRVETVLKRSHSSESEHVDISSWNGKPSCTTGLENIKKRHKQGQDDLAKDGYYNWIHQEYVPSLEHWGELRVFIATRPRVSAFGKRKGGREPYVVRMVRSRFLSPEDRTKDRKGKYMGNKELGELVYNGFALIPVPVSSSSSSSLSSTPKLFAKYPHITIAEVTNYALKTYRALQALKSPGYQTLEVGARLDIGIAPGKRGLFVNEITRWHSADFFSSFMDEGKQGQGKQDDVCAAYAQAFAECYPAEKAGAEDSRTEEEETEEEAEVEAVKEAAGEVVNDKNHPLHSSDSSLSDIPQSKPSRRSKQAPPARRAKAHRAETKRVEQRDQVTDARIAKRLPGRETRAMTRQTRQTRSRTRIGMLGAYLE